MDPRRAAGLIRTLSEAIHYAHGKGIIHRDLKPQNILIDSDGQPQITDFGLAKNLNQESGLTLSGAVMGSPSFIPPEQASGKNSKVGPQSDLYALGAILYFLLTGKPPFRASTPMDTMKLVLEKDPEKPSSLVTGLPEDIETICLRCMEKEPENRYETASDLAEELSRFLRNQTILARRITRKEQFVKWVRRNPAVATLSGAVLLVSLVGLLGVSWQLHQTRKALRSAEEKALAEATALAPVM